MVSMGGKTDVSVNTIFMQSNSAEAERLTQYIIQGGPKNRTVF